MKIESVRVGARRSGGGASGRMLGTGGLLLIGAIVATGPALGQAPPVIGTDAHDAGAVARDAGPASHEAVQRVTLNLSDAVATALTQNRDVQDALYALDVASGQVSEAWGSVYPTVDLATSYSRNLSPTVTFLPAVIFDPSAGPDDFLQVQFGADNTWQLNVNVDQPLFEAQAFIGVGAAGRFKSFQREVVRGRTQAVVTRVRTVYYDLLLAQEQLRLLSNSVERVDQSLAETRALNEAGLAADYDVLRLEVELANLVPNLRRAENGIERSRRNLGVELALDDLQAIDVSGSLASMELDDLDANTPANQEILRFSGLGIAAPMAAETVVRSAQLARSDILQSELNESLRHTELRLEQVEYLPKVSLFGSYSILAQQNGSPDFFGGRGQRGYSRIVGVRVTLPLFQGFKRHSRIGQKRATLRQAEIQTALVRDQAERQVRDLLDEVEETRLRAKGQRLAVDSATRGYEIASAQYREGLGSQLELTDSEEALRQSEFNYAQAVYDYLVAQARLDEAAGQVPLVDVHADRVEP